MSSRKPKPPKSSGGNTDESEKRRRLAEAQLLVDRAFDEDDPERQIALANAALELSPDCAEAYLILAENEPISEEAISLYEAGVGAASRMPSGKSISSRWRPRHARASGPF